MPAPASSLFQFIDAYHLWSVVILLCVIGTHHLATFFTHLGFRLCGDVHEEYYAFKLRIAETRQRYQRAVRSVETHQPVPHSGGD